MAASPHVRSTTSTRRAPDVAGTSDTTPDRRKRADPHVPGRPAATVAAGPDVTTNR
jgi:hypothetical protein